MSSDPRRPEMRIGDAEREAAVSALGEHYAAGRLSKEEYDERSAVAYAARTSSDLWPLFVDLPQPTRTDAGPREQQGAGPRQESFWRTARVPMILILVGLVLFTPVKWPLLFVLFAWLMLTRRRGHAWHHHGPWTGPSSRR